MAGHQRCTSLTQLDSVDRGPITMKGPGTFMLRRCAKSPMVCHLQLPNPRHEQD